MSYVDLPMLFAEINPPSKILVVDNHPLNIQVLNKIFEDDHEVLGVTNGVDALAFCQSQPPDLILLDVMMPDMDGYEVCRRLKSHPLTRDIPVIFVTAQSDTIDEEQGLDVGAVDFIAKSASAKVIKARVATHLTLKRQADLLRTLALVDGLTGIANRRHFDEVLDAEWRRGIRKSTPLSLILIDIDYFKRFNDSYGHLAGDQCLQQVATTIKGAFTRSHDLVARYGGEELACVLPDTPLEGATAKARMLESAVRALGISNSGSEIDGQIVTISLGVATVIPEQQRLPATLIQFTDRLLYAAKQAGRAQVKAQQMKFE
jgi:diguanylate cyclase (GGDEF)-like protein